MAVTRGTLALQRRISAELNKILDTQERALVSAWVDAWDEIAPDLNTVLVEMLLAGNRVTRAQLLRSTRLRKVLAVIADQLDALAEGAGVRIIGDLDTIIERAGAAQASVIDSQMPPGTDLVSIDAWSRIDVRQISAIVQRTTEQITSLTRPISAEAYDVVRRELIRGVAAGANPKATAARIMKRTERVGFNGGLNRALTIARTESLDAHRVAAAVAQAAQADVLAGWSWLAKLDTKTCPSCWAQHGSLHDLAEPGPYDHQCGRCGRMPVTKSWAELGITGVEEPPSLLPDSASVFENLPSEDQLEILGPGRFAAWIRGDFPMEAWSVRRTTPGWRDSYGVASLPQSGGRSRLVA